jgi:hypothetical protein
MMNPQHIRNSIILLMVISVANVVASFAALHAARIARDTQLSCTQQIAPQSRTIAIGAACAAPIPVH